MSYQTLYVGTRQENEEKALQDCRDYLGADFGFVLEQLREVAHDTTFSRTMRYYFIQMNLTTFLGISGYWPVRAMVREASK